MCDCHVSTRALHCFSGCAGEPYRQQQLGAAEPLLRPLLGGGGKFVAGAGRRAAAGPAPRGLHPEEARRRRPPGRQRQRPAGVGLQERPVGARSHRVTQHWRELEPHIRGKLQHTHTHTRVGLLANVLMTHDAMQCN